MDSNEFYQEILGVTSPWYVNDTVLNSHEQEVNIYLEHLDTQSHFKCPECQKVCAIYDHSASRKWRHLDTCQMKTFIHASLPRIQCPKHGVLQVAADWARDHSRFTLMMEKLVLNLLYQIETVSAITEITGISWHSIFRILESYLKDKESSMVEYPTCIGIDEKAILKGHKYMTIIYDLSNSKVIDIIEGRKKGAVVDYFKSIPMKSRQKIECICMDMWPAYYEAVVETIPSAHDKIVYDKFHIIKYLNDAVNSVRKEEHQHLNKYGDSPLKKTKYHWLYREENIPEKIKDDFEELRSSKLKTARAWHLKEMFRPLFDYKYPAYAESYFNQWFSLAKRSKLEPIKRVADMLKRHIKNIITYAKFRITNGKAESINSKIMTVKRKARGHRNFNNLKNLIFFFMGKFTPYP